MQIGHNYDLRNFNARHHVFFSNNAKAQELQTEDHPGLDRPPVAFTKAGVVSPLATFTTHYLRLFLETEHGTTVRIAAYENIEVIIYKNKKNRPPA